MPMEIQMGRWWKAGFRKKIRMPEMIKPRMPKVNANCISETFTPRSLPSLIRLKKNTMPNITQIKEMAARVRNRYKISLRGIGDEYANVMLGIGF
jgi:hypothetical protein